MQAVRIMSREEFAIRHKAKQIKRRRMIAKHDKLVFRGLVVIDLIVWVAVWISR